MRTKRTLAPGAEGLGWAFTEGAGSELMRQICRAVLCFELRLTIAINSFFSLGREVRIEPLSVTLSSPPLLYKAQEFVPMDILQGGAAPLLKRCNRSISESN